MKRWTDLGFLFTVVAVVELIYALAGTLIPPSMVKPIIGWVLSSDGHWLTKLLSMALASQAWVAWTMRKDPHIGVAWALAFYQLASATMDWAMWVAMADQDIFSTVAGRVSVIISIPTHYILGLLLVFAIRAHSRRHHHHHAAQAKEAVGA